MGCSASKSTHSIPISKSLTPGPTSGSPTRVSNPLSTRIVENCLVVWLCEDIPNRYEDEKDNLRRWVYQLKTFDARDLCLSFIRRINDEKIFLIVSDRHQSKTDFEYLPQVEKLYFFHSSASERDETNGIVIRNTKNLSQQLQQDIELCEADLVSITSLPSSNNPVQEAAFLFAQTVKEVIYGLKFETGAKNVLVDCCRIYYADNAQQLRMIEEFDNNYRPNQALRWLINSCFISKILNRAQRTSEVDILYKLGFFIKQVNLQLARLSEENGTVMEHPTTAYHGKTMSNTDFDILVKDNHCGLLSFNTFLISSTKKESTVDFIRHRLALHPDLMGVLFEIDIDPKRRHGRSSFALLNAIHTKKDQICFDLSTIFHIESIVPTTDTSPAMWTVKLSLVHDDDQQLNRLLASIRTDELHSNPVPILGKLLIDMGEHRRAEGCFLGLLKDPSVLSQPRRLTRVHKGLGAIYTQRGEYVKSLEHYQQALQTSLIYLPSDHPDLVPIYKAIGDSHWHAGDYLSAAEKYEKAVALLELSASQNHSDILVDLHIRVNEARQSIPEKD